MVVASGRSGIVSPVMALSEKLRSQERPPDLRRGNARKRCQLCVHFAPTQKKCRLYDWPVRSTQLCDSFEAAGGGGKE